MIHIHLLIALVILNFNFEHKSIFLEIKDNDYDDRYEKAKMHYKFKYVRFTNEYRFTVLRLNATIPKFWAPSYVLLDDNKKGDVVPFPDQELLKSKIRLYCMNDILVNDEFIVTMGKGIITRFDYGEINRTFVVLGHVDVGIGAYFYFNTFGHHIRDVLGAIVMTPANILAEMPYVFTNWQCKSLQAYLDALGLGYFKVFQYWRDSQFVHCNRFYFYSPKHVAHEYVGIAVLKMRKMFNDHLNLDKIRAEKYFLLNKKRGENRYFTNFDLILKTLNKKFSQIHWEITSLAPDLCDRAKIFASAKFLIVSCGSIVINSMFMKEKSALIYLCGDLVDLPNAAICAQSGLYSIGIQHANILHHSGNGAANIKNIIEAVKKLLYMQETGKFSYLKGYIPVYNLSCFKKHFWSEKECKVIGFDVTNVIQ